MIRRGVLPVVPAAVYVEWWRGRIGIREAILRAVIILLECLAVTVPLLVAVAYMTYVDRKVWASIQLRRGPNVVGPFGLLQPLADGVKLFLKETIVPSSANSILLRNHLLATGRFLTVLPESVLRYHAKQWSLKALPIELGVKPRSVVIVTLKNRRLSPVAQLFAEHVRAVANTMSPQSPSG